MSNPPYDFDAQERRRAALASISEETARANRRVSDQESAAGSVRGEIMREELRAGRPFPHPARTPGDDEPVLGDLAFGTQPCPDSPAETCVYDRERDPACDFCLYCGEPDERK